MNETAQPHKTQVLITDADSYLASELTASLISQNCSVFGVGKNPPPAPILQDHDFTLLDINLAQPLPAYLPQFDIIFLFVNTKAAFGDLLSQTPNLTTANTNIISQARQGKSQVVILADILTGTTFFENLQNDENTRKSPKLFLIGDIYGPKMPLSQKSGQNELVNLISQAVTGDKIILEKEGLSMIYPAYISDAIFAINKFIFSPSAKNIHLIISEEPKTSLTVAYTIQNVARLTLNKELNLYFSSPPSQVSETGPAVRITDLGFTPKVELENGLKNTFEYYRKQVKSDNKNSTTRQTADKISSPIQLSRAAYTGHLPKTLIPRLPSLKLLPHLHGSRFKKGLALILLVLILTLGKTALDLYLGVANLKSAQNALYSGDFKKAKDKAKSATASFNAASGKVRLLTYPASFVFPEKIQGANFILESAATAARSLTYFVDGSQALVRDFQIITAYDQKEAFDLDVPSANFRKANELASQAVELARIARRNGISSGRIVKFEESLTKLSNISASSFELVNLTGDLIGAGGKKTYLVILQNNTELRPGGGFIGNFGLIQFEDGKFKGISVEDIYTVDGQLKEKITPPLQLTEKLGITNLYLRDSNWTTDFGLNAATIRDFYKKETGQDVDGVIALDLTFVQNLLAQIGPIKLADYNEEITSQNLFERGETHSEVGFFPGSSQKKDFFSTLTRTLLNQILDSLKNPSKQENGKAPWLALVETAKDSLSQKHLMLIFDNPNLAVFIKTKGWDHPLPPANFNPADDSVETRDFLALSEANLGANKVNRFLNRKIDYEMTIGRDADLVGKLKITYTNNSQANTWPAGPYVNFLRVYLPPAASLFEYKQSLRSSQQDADAGLKNGDTSDIAKVDISPQGSLTVLATYVEVPPKSSREVVFTYRIPKNIQLEKAPTYHLYIQKQPGTLQDSFTFTFNLPAYVAIKSINSDKSYQDRQNVTIESDLSTDREFIIEVAKK